MSQSSCSATYSDDSLTVTFSAILDEYPEGDEVTDIRITSVSLLGFFIDYKRLPSVVTDAIHLLSNELEFETSDSSDYDDIGEN